MKLTRVGFRIICLKVLIHLMEILDFVLVGSKCRRLLALTRFQNYRLTLNGKRFRVSRKVQQLQKLILLLTLDYREKA